MVQARSLCGDDPSVVHYDGGDLHFLGMLVLHNWYRPLAQAKTPTGPIGASIALCFLVRKSVYEAVGGFDEHLFILYEDNEFSYKVRMRGHTIRLCAEALCTHKAGTAGLSMRGEGAAYPAAARSCTAAIVGCAAGLHALAHAAADRAGAVLLYGVVYAAFGHQRGHMRDWWRAKWDLLKLIPTALRARGPAQRGRTVADRDLLVAAPMTSIRASPNGAPRPRCAAGSTGCSRATGGWCGGSVAEPAANAPQVGALLLNFRHAALTVTCLRDLLAQTAVPVHVLVIDNGSGDDSPAVLQRAIDELAAPGASRGPHRVELLALPQNLGFTGGMNRGFQWAAAQGLPFALVLNNDLRLPPDFLLPLVQVLQNDPRVAAGAHRAAPRRHGLGRGRQPRLPAERAAAARPRQGAAAAHARPGAGAVPAGRVRAV